MASQYDNIKTRLRLLALGNKNMPQKPQLNFRWAGIYFCTGLAGSLGLIAPFVIAKHYGHGWGLLVAWLAVIGNLIGWFYWGMKTWMLPLTRIIWLLGLVMLVVISVFVLTHLPR
jgi:hypothetical protein